MKKYFFTLIILLSLPTFASCLIDNNGGACSIAEIQNQQPMHRRYSPQSTIKEFSGSAEARLKPSQDDKPSQELRDFGPKPANYSYNTDCQFGICNKSGTPQLFEKRGQ